MKQLSLPRGYRNAEILHNKLHTLDESVLTRRGQRRALDLFHAMAQRVPAYKAFLKAQKFDPSSVKSMRDFHKIPPINKDNYLRVYPREDLCWDGKFAEDNSWVISTTSGSTGQPYYFPRTDLQDRYLTTTTELYLRSNFSIQNKTTLYIDAFPMGAWIGGVFTYESIRQIAEKGYDISIITPGIHKLEVINAVKQLADDFDQIIIGAYAPFLKDILDDGTRQGIDWARYNVGFVFSAEAFTEKFRDYVFDVTKPDEPLKATLNHYGTVDLGTMAHETPESILIRRTLAHEHKLDVLFPEQRRQATFAQYDPSLFYFEEEVNGLLCTAYSGLPLVRYDLKDYGGVMSRKQVHAKLQAAGLEPSVLIKEAGVQDTTWNLPFVYVYERNDFSVSYYAFLIYPDTIRRALQADELKGILTGKFTMLTDYSAEGRQELLIHVELTHGTEASDELTNQIKMHIHGFLQTESSEYRETVNTVGKVAEPVVTLWPYEDATYFRPGTKQKWVVK